MKKSIFQSIILLALIMVLACLFYLTPDKKSKNSHPVSSGSVSYIKPGSGIGGGDINGNAVAGKKSLPIYCVKHDDSEKCISISFDAAWGADDTIEILNTLDKYNVKATFFLIGENAENTPELVKRESEEGHLVGNHTYHHVEITRVPDETAKEEILMTNEVITGITGEEVSYMRPPFGAWQKKLEWELDVMPVMWTIDPLDWATNNEDEIVNKVVTQAKENDIILLHDCYESSVNAALRIVDILQKEGFEFVTVDELIMN